MADDAVAALADDAVTTPKKKPKRFWQLVDEFGQPLSTDTRNRLQGASPYQAALKAVTRYTEEQGQEYTFFLQEIAPRRAAKAHKIYVYKGWKAPLQEHEKSVFTEDHKITSKPHAKSQGTITIEQDIRVTRANCAQEQPTPPQ